jgi:crotonobetainyl-CoA:carnitine CoA-transferase CaiB-like acyl-CoA transferase
MGTIGIITALINRAKHGGAQKVSVSLARTGMWIQDQGVGPHPNVDEVIKFAYETVSQPQVSQNQIVTKTNYGEITHLGPIIDYSETQGRWDHPTPILGEHLAEWLK